MSTSPAASVPRRRLPPGAAETHLTPLIGAAKRSRFATWDLESKDGPTQNAGFTRVFLAGLYDGEDYNSFFDTRPDSGKPDDWKSRYFLPGGCVDRLMRCCLQEAYQGYTFYAHNAGNFDFLFLLPWLVRQKQERDLQIGLVPLGASGLLAIEVWKTKQKWARWRFVDSVRLLPMTLDQAATAFGAGKKSHLGLGARGSGLGTGSHKGMVPPATDGSGRLLDRYGKPFTIHCPEDDPGWAPYNEQDCRLLYDVLTRAHDLVEIEFGGEIGLTAPATAMRTFRRAHLKTAIPREVHTHAFVRRGYVGGRTEVIAEEGHHLSYFDINSSYAYQMTLTMPAGESRTWEKGEPPPHWKEERIGFCDVLVEVPDDIALPPLPVKANPQFFPEGSGVAGKLVFPTGLLRGVWEWGELQNAIDCGCRIVQWFESVWYEKQSLLKDFVTTLYKYRNQAKCFTCSGDLDADFYCEACKKTGYDSGLDMFAKLLANSTYGKFAQTPLRGKFYWVTDPEMPEGCTPLVEEDPHCQVWFKEEEADAPFILPQISARITALARVHLHRFAMEALHRVLRECMTCRSKVTFHRDGDRRGLDRRRPAFAQLQRDGGKEGWKDGGGSGHYGDHESPERITRDCPCCPCGGALETRFGRVYYMDTDAIKTDVVMPTGTELGEWKDEVPRFSGFLEGRFYGPKMYRLSVEQDYRDLPEPVRRRMLERDKKYFAKLKSDHLADVLRGNIVVKVTGPNGQETSETKVVGWDQVKAKGMGKKNRTAENLELLYQGALVRLAWIADVNNHHPDGSLKPMPKDVETAGTVLEQRLEKVGTLARLLKRNPDGKPRLMKEKDGTMHKQSAAFERGPMMRTVPKRLHLDGAKRIHLGDGTTRAYHIDMSRKLGTNN